MALFKNIIVPVPPEASYVRTTGRVYLIRKKVYNSETQYNVDKRTTIGKLNSNSGKTMNPNDMYAFLYREEFSKAAKGKEAPVIKRVGMYAFALAIGLDTKLYPLLVDTLGPQNANFVMDFAMFMIVQKSNVAKDFEVLMKDHMLFSEKLYSDSTISRYLEHLITKEQIEAFKEKWAATWLNQRPEGRRKVWACADGCNNNCEAEDVEFAEKGHAKSLKNIDIYAYMHIIDAETGDEITYLLYRGGKVDSKAFVELMEVLKRYGLELAGIILDRGFCTYDCLLLIQSLKMSYVIMMPEGLHGYKQMVAQYGEGVKQIKNVCAGNMYAVEGKAKVFKSHDLESKIVLCYDNKNGPERENYLVNNVLEAAEKANKEYDENPMKKPQIDDRWSRYLNILVSDNTFKKENASQNTQKESTQEENPDASQKSAEKLKNESQKITGDSGENSENKSNGKDSALNEIETPDKPENEKEDSQRNTSSYLPIKVYANPYCSIKEETLQKEVAVKGFSCMATSDDINAKTAVKIYDLRDKNEKLYMVIKSQLNSDVARVWYTNGVESKHLIVMIASMLRHKLENACKECGYILTTAIRELNLLVIQRTSDDVYFAVNNANTKQEELMAKFNISYDSFADIASQETNRVKKIGVWEQVHTMARPEIHEPETDTNIEPEPRKRGRPKGSTKKNSENAEEVEPKVHKKRGRPIGSKNKPKTETEKEENKEPRKPGRPKGSKNKKGAINAKAKRAAAKNETQNAS